MSRYTPTDEKPCLYDPERGCVVDFVKEDGSLHYPQVGYATEEEALAECPHFVRLPFGVAMARISEFNAEKYNAGVATYVTEEDFEEALNVLPPMRWKDYPAKSGLTYNAFHVSERLAGDLVNWYVRTRSGLFWTCVAGSTEIDRVIEAVEVARGYQASA